MIIKIDPTIRYICDRFNEAGVEFNSDSDIDDDIIHGVKFKLSDLNDELHTMAMSFKRNKDHMYRIDDDIMYIIAPL